jgi:HprK-related kinase A
VSELEDVLQDFASLYREFRQDEGIADDPIRMEIRTSRRAWHARRRYVICGDGEELGSARRKTEVVPYLEWGINWRVIARRREYLQLHAAAMVHEGQGLLFAARSGAGKSTLAVGLLSRGWKYLSDEFALINPDTLQLHPFPKALCIKAGAFDVIRRLNVPLWRRRYFVKAFKGRVGYVCPHEVSPHPVAGPSPIRFVIFPKYIEGVRPRVYPLSRAQAALALAGCVMNRDAFGDRGTAILADVVRKAECFGLESGPIEATCDLIESLSARGGGPDASRRAPLRVAAKLG